MIPTSAAGSFKKEIAAGRPEDFPERIPGVAGNHKWEPSMPRCSEGNCSSGTDDLLPTRQSLLDKLKDWGDDRSWQEFFDTYWRLIYGVALKSGLRASEAEDVVQETVLSVAKAMKDFQYDPARGSFKGWLLQLTGWRIKRQFQQRPREGRELKDETGPEPSPETGIPQPDDLVPRELQELWDKEWEDAVLWAALERVRRKLNPKHFQIFDLCVTKGLPPQEVQHFLGVSSIEVYLSRHRVARKVRREVKRLRERLF
jgi:RNA polymerase sigma factor (sigma-70 family)